MKDADLGHQEHKNKEINYATMLLPEGSIGDLKFISNIALHNTLWIYSESDEF
jgi:hypothetical protein